MKLDYDVLTYVSETVVDPMKDRALDLRGLKIPRIENLAITKDLHDTIDLTDNDLQRLDNLPPMMRLRHLLVSNNRVRRIDPAFGSRAPNLESLVLAGNALAELADLEPLAGLRRLTHLCLVDNPVAKKRHYRLALLKICPSLRFIDFQRVRDSERKESRILFATAEGKALLSASLTASSSSSKRAATTGGGGDAGDSDGDGDDGGPAAKRARASGPAPLSAEEAARLRQALEKATTLEEMERLRRLLEAGAASGGGVAALPK
ncbi:U2 small nuclear ribonucleoprotein A' [Cladochytrium tenue]|nr:U2 small nuclear ribonucleoprotein A' [Cladochytrium tenue]